MKEILEILPNKSASLFTNHSEHSVLGFHCITYKYILWAMANFEPLEDMSLETKILSVLYLHTL